MFFLEKKVTIQSVTRKFSFLVGVCSTIFFSAILVSPHNANGAELRFVDKTIEAGLSHPLAQSFGLSWGDFDQDGWMDLYIRNHAGRPSLYKNRGNGTFDDITIQSGIALSGDFHGASWGDFDNDGDMDLYQIVGSPDAEKVNFFYRNDSPSGIFTDIAESSGVLDPTGRGRTPVWFDYDMDAYLDLLICNLLGTDSFTMLFHNDGDGNFTDVTSKSGLVNIGAALGLSVGDYDNDGDLDLFISRRSPELYQNRGDGTFENVTLAAGLSGLTRVRDLALGDYDNDKDLDLYFVRKNEDDDAYMSDLDLLQYKLRVKNNVEKGFEFTVSASVVEFDIYRFGIRENPDYIFIGSDAVNPETVPFSLDSISPLPHGIPPYSPGIDSGTYIWYEESVSKWHIRHSIGESRAGLGVIVSCPAAIVDVLPVGLEIDTTPVPNKLFQNQGDGTFIDVTDQAGVGDLHQGQSAVWADFDNDGDLDLYVVNCGRILNESNILYENLGNGTFVNVASEAGADALTEGQGESVSVADYDNDGFIDLLVLNGLGIAPFSYGRRVLLHNERTENNWLQIRLIGRISNRDGIGASVSVEAGPLKFTRQQTGGMHCFSQNSQILQFGLGDKVLADRLTVYWPSGIVQQLSNIDVNQRLVVEEPSVSLSLSPNSVTVPQGGVLEIQVEGTNHTGEDQYFLFGTNVTLPNGHFYPPLPDLLFGPIWVPLGPYETVYDTLTHDIPSDAFLGNHVYNAAVGRHPWIIWNEDHFEFTITPAYSERR